MCYKLQVKCFLKVQHYPWTSHEKLEEWTLNTDDLSENIKSPRWVIFRESYIYCRQKVLEIGQTGSKLPPPDSTRIKPDNQSTQVLSIYSPRFAERIPGQKAVTLTPSWWGTRRHTDQGYRSGCPGRALGTCLQSSMFFVLYWWDCSEEDHPGRSGWVWLTKPNLCPGFWTEERHVSWAWINAVFQKGLNICGSLRRTLLSPLTRGRNSVRKCSRSFGAHQNWVIVRTLLC